MNVSADNQKIFLWLLFVQPQNLIDLRCQKECFGGIKSAETRLTGFVCNFFFLLHPQLLYSTYTPYTNSLSPDFFFCFTNSNAVVQQTAKSNNFNQTKTKNLRCQIYRIEWRLIGSQANKSSFSYICFIDV